MTPSGVQWRTHHILEAFRSAQRGTPLDLFAQTGLVSTTSEFAGVGVEGEVCETEESRPRDRVSHSSHPAWVVEESTIARAGSQLHLFHLSTLVLPRFEMPDFRILKG